MIALREKAKVKSVYDGCRHSYASYRIRQLKGNLAELAAEMGNSPAMVYRHYREVVKPKDVEAYWNILPAGEASNIVPMMATA